MANYVYLLDIASIKLVPKNAALDPKFHIKHFSEFLMEDQFLPHQFRKYYAQKYQTNDPLYFQFVSNFGPVTCRLLDKDGNIVVNGVSAAIASTYYSAPFTCYGCSINLAGLAKGMYQVELTVGSNDNEVVFVSEPLQIDTDLPGTILIQYSNVENDYGAIFQNGEQFAIRVEGAIDDFKPASNDVVYEDEPANITRLSSTPYRIFKGIFGGEEGIPDWMIDKINRASSCDTVLYDGKQFVKNEGAKWEGKSEDDYPLKGWNIELREAKARNGLTVENSIPLNNGVTVLYIGETQLFGTLTGDALIKKVE